MEGFIKRRGAMSFAIAGVIFLAGSAWRATGLSRGAEQLAYPQEAAAETSPTASMAPYVDTHAHFDAKILSDPEGEVEAALQEMSRENAAKLIFMPGPFLPDDPNRFDYEAFVAAVKKHPGRLAFQGGGGSLNVMIQEAVRANDASAEVLRKFKQRAEKIALDGAAGFGELTAEHLSFLPGQAYEYAPADHPLLLLLADIAAVNGMPIDLHSEAVPRAMALPFDLKSPPNPPQLKENIAALERLLAHNRQATIVWAHAGSDNTGERTPDLCRRLLKAHSNLYMEIKIDPLSLGKNPPFANGVVKPEWMKLFSDFPYRFVIGTDQHYASGRPMTGPQRWKMAALLLNQLPADLRRKIGMENALRIFPIATTK